MKKSMLSFSTPVKAKKAIDAQSETMQRHCAERRSEDQKRGQEARMAAHMPIMVPESLGAAFATIVVRRAEVPAIVVAQAEVDEEDEVDGEEVDEAQGNEMDLETTSDDVVDVDEEMDSDSSSNLDEPPRSSHRP